MLDNKFHFIKNSISNISEAPVDEEKLGDSDSDNSPKDGTSESDVEEDDTTQAAAEVTSEQPRGLGNL